MEDTPGPCAQLGQDYNLPTKQVTFDGSGTPATKTINIPIRQDITKEPTEYFWINIYIEFAGTVLTSDFWRRKITINNHPTENYSTVSFASRSSSVREGNRTHNVQVNLSPSNPVPTAFHIHYSIGGTATRDIDFTAPATITATHGVSSLNIPLSIKQDSGGEGDEKIVLTLTSGSSYVLGSSTQLTHTVTIIDNDPINRSSSGGVRVGPQSLTLEEGDEDRLMFDDGGDPIACLDDQGQPLLNDQGQPRLGQCTAGEPSTISVSLTVDPGLSTVRVNVLSFDVTAVTVTPSSLSFDTTDWHVAKELTVQPVADSDTDDESVVIDMSVTGFGSADQSLQNIPVNVTVTDDDTVGHSGGGGGGTTTPPPVTPPPVTPPPPPPTTTGGGGGGGATPPPPPEPPPESVAESTAEEEPEVVVPPEESEPESEPEPELPALIGVSMADTTVAEGERAYFIVQLEAVADTTVRIPWVTVSGTARAGQDYVAGRDTLRIPPGATHDTLFVQTQQDQLAEADETFTVQLKNTRPIISEADEADETDEADEPPKPVEAVATILDDDGGAPPEEEEPVEGETAFDFAEEVEDQAYTAGTAITALVLPEATGGAGAITYRVVGLPAGLTFAAATRTISGTPEAATEGAVEVAYTAQDRTEATRTLTFSIVVNPPLSFGDFDLFDLFDLFHAILDDDGGLPPEEEEEPVEGEPAFDFAEEVEDQTYTAGAAITALVLPEATGGAGAITYRVVGLPAGLTFAAATRTISGTPEAATEGAVEVAYTAQDRTEATRTLTFSIVVNPPPRLGDLFDLFDLFHAGGG